MMPRSGDIQRDDNGGEDPQTWVFVRSVTLPDGPRYDPNRLPCAGEILHVTKAASVQFSAPLLFRVIRAKVYGHTPEGWIWLDGYELSNRGDAIERREIFVQLAGLRPLQQRKPAKRVPAAAKTGNVPRPRSATHDTLPTAARKR